MPTSATGQFRFFAAPGAWTVRILAPGAEPVDHTVTAATGMIAELEIRVGWLTPAPVRHQPRDDSEMITVP